LQQQLELHLLTFKYFTAMRKPQLLLYFVFLFLTVACSKGAQALNEKLVELEKSFAEGKVTSYNEAKNLLKQLSLECQEQLAKIEFESDEESVREVENLKKVQAKIDAKIAQFTQEEQDLNAIREQAPDSYEQLQKTSEFISAHPDGLLTYAVKQDYQTSMGEFIDKVSNKLNTQLTSLNEDNTTNNLYQTVGYVHEVTGSEVPEDLTATDFEEALNHFSSVKQNIISVVDNQHVDIVSPNGNSPKSLKEQFDRYENNLKSMRAKAEAYIRQLVTQEIANGGWDEQAREEIRAYVLRDRGGFFSTCDGSTLTNDITQAEENKMTLLSDRVQIKLHYNVNSYCGNNIKTKYYDGVFTLIFPVINKQLGSGYFNDRNIIRTE
jgi:hypothetical protein